MKIVICGSMHFAKDILIDSKLLESLGFEVILPPTLNEGKTAKEMTSTYSEFLKMKQELARTHFNSISKSDAILVINNSKNGIDGYIGGATFSEIAFAFYLKKKIFFLNPIPEITLFVDELRSFEPIILARLEQIKNYF